MHMYIYRKRDLGCYLDNSAGVYKDGEVIGRLVSMIRKVDADWASQWCIDWIGEIVTILSTSDTAKDDILESLQSDIDELTDRLNNYCDSDVLFVWEDNSLSLVDNS